MIVFTFDNHSGIHFQVKHVVMRSLAINARFIINEHEPLSNGHVPVLGYPTEILQALIIRYRDSE